MDKKGKEKKKYDIYLTPYEKLKSLPGAEKYLKPGVAFAALDKIAYARSDNEFAKILQDEKDKLFNSFKTLKLRFPTIFLSRAQIAI